jgi:hypothetical protein
MILRCTWRFWAAHALHTIVPRTLSSRGHGHIPTTLNVPLPMALPPLEGLLAPPNSSARQSVDLALNVVRQQRLPVLQKCLGGVVQPIRERWRVVREQWSRSHVSENGERHPSAIDEPLSWLDLQPAVTGESESGVL